MTRDQAAHLLGVIPSAPTSAVHAAWRRKAAHAHPDAGGSQTAFCQATEARDVLLSPPPAEPPTERPAYHPAYAYSHAYTYSPPTWVSRLRYWWVYRVAYRLPNIPWGFVLTGLAAYFLAYSLAGVDWSGLWYSFTTTTWAQPWISPLSGLPPGTLSAIVAVVLMQVAGSLHLGLAKVIFLCVGLALLAPDLLQLLGSLREFSAVNIP